MKRIIINESQYIMLNEGLSSNLFHFTSLSNGFNICNDDVIYLQSAFAKDADNYDNKRKFYLSCTRIRSSQFGYSYKFSKGCVRIALDGDLLSNNFKGKSINYWNGLNDKYYYYKGLPKDSDELMSNNVYNINRFKKNNPNATEDDIKKYIEHNFNDSAQHHTDNESEDRLFSYEPAIYDAHKYIKSIDVLMPNLFENEDYTKMAASFLFHTNPNIRGLIKIYDSLDEFNNVNGKNCNDKVEYSFSETSFSSRSTLRTYNGLESTVVFIAYGNPEFEGKKFGSAVMNLLKKYGLEKYKSNIGKMEKRRMSVWGFDGMIESVSASRRELSDKPSDDNSKILKMLTDYILSLGANSFREAILKKKEMVDEFYGHGEKIYQKIDTSIKYDFYNFKYGIISLYPEKDLFKDAMGWDGDEVRNWADSFASIIMYEGEGYNYSRSKNYNSLFQYIHKLFRVGTISQVMKAFKEFGFTSEYLKNEWNIRVVKLDYWDALRMNTINSSKIDGSDWRKASKLKDKEIGKYFLEKQSNNGSVRESTFKSNRLINENRLKWVDLSDVGMVNYEWFFDEDEYNDWLEDNELEDSEETRNQYYTEEVTYEVEYLDNETYHTIAIDQNLLYDDLVDLFGEDMSKKMLLNCIKDGKGSFETYELYENNTYDLSNPDEVNDIAMKLFSHGEYYKDCRGFILTNGVIVYTPSEHNEILMIPGVKDKLDFVEMGNIRILPQSIDIGAEPTYEQNKVLRQVIASYSDEELYLDFFTKGGEIGVKYINPDWRYVMGEIDRFYSEGIRPQGCNGMYESKMKKRTNNGKQQLK